jgi:hypothetical protein
MTFSRALSVATVVQVAGLLDSAAVMDAGNYNLREG